MYFHVSADTSQLPRECGMSRVPWSDSAARDAPPAAAQLARRVLAAGAARWGAVKGMRFEPRGALQTPWNRGTWGVLPDRPSTLFADFGGAQHELAFEAWPEFTSTRCSDGEVVRGSLLPGE